MTSTDVSLSRAFRRVTIGYGPGIRCDEHECSEMAPRIMNALHREYVGSMERTFYINTWTVVHFLSGLAAGTAYIHMGFPKRRFAYYGSLIVLHTGWEVYQGMSGVASMARLTGNNNLVDSIIDTVAFTAGIALVAYFNKV